MKTAVMAICKHCGKDHSDCGDWCPAHSGDVERANRSCLPKFVLKAGHGARFRQIWSIIVILSCVYIA